MLPNLPEHPGEVVARPQGDDRAGRGGAERVLADVVQALEHPTINTKLKVSLVSYKSNNVKC